ncbi:MAG: zf-TFIIB domain-containing protein [Nitrospinota bacterium]
MKCPACESQLSEKKVSGIGVFACIGSCGGFWFPYKQAKKIKRVKPGAGCELLNLDKAYGVKIYRGAEHPCPQCKTTLLYRHFYSKDLDTEVNQCSKCSGFWIDAGGLIDIIKTSKNEDLIAKYFTILQNEKISGMNLANPDIAEAASMMIAIFKFINPGLRAK